MTEYQFTEVTAEQRQQMVLQRIAQYEVDLFGHQMNMTAVQALPDSDTGKPDAISTEQSAIVTLTTSIAALRPLADQK